MKKWKVLTIGHRSGIQFVDCGHVSFDCFACGASHIIPHYSRMRALYLDT